MSEFNEINWVEALTSVYNKSVEDPVYRELCVTNPVEAIKQVSDIELPPGLKIQMFGKREDFLYCFLLPPVPAAGANRQEIVDEFVRWQTFCTNLTTG